jgi:hypothetical protein
MWRRCSSRQLLAGIATYRKRDVRWQQVERLLRVISATASERAVRRVRVDCGSLEVAIAPAFKAASRTTNRSSHYNLLTEAGNNASRLTEPGVTLSVPSTRYSTRSTSYSVRSDSYEVLSASVSYDVLRYLAPRSGHGGLARNHLTRGGGRTQQVLHPATAHRPARWQRGCRTCQCNCNESPESA